MRDLAGKTAIITGASRGLGPYIARALAGERMRLVLAARSLPELEAVAGEIKAGGGDAVAVQTDVLDREALRSLVQTAVERFGAIDVLVNNAGIEHFLEYHLLDVDEIERMVSVNLLAPMLLTRLVLPGMLERRCGHIVNIASLAGKGMPGYAEPYVATKAALIGFSASLRATYRSRGVSASAIVPGFVAEAGIYQQNTQEAGDFSPPVLRTTTPQAVARAVVKAIKRDAPELIVNPIPTRLFLAMRELTPSLGEWIAERIGVSTVFRRLALIRGGRHGTLGER